MNFKLTAMAAAVASLGAASAQAATDFIQAAGASAFHAQGEALVVQFCNTGSTFKYTSGIVESVTGSSHANDVIRTICISTNTQWGLNATLDFSYDSFGGSWKGFTAAGAIAISSVPSINQEPVRTVDITSCSGTTTTVTISSQAVTLIAGCAETTPQTTGGVTSIGFTDVEPSLFFAAPTENQPPPAASGVSFPTSLGSLSLQVPLLGVTWAVGASKPLWLAMEADQTSAGILASSCSSNIDESNQACAPFISKTQYKSIVQGSGQDGDLHFDLVDLFSGTAPAGILTLVRRDLGSGTQAASNAYFLNIGCTARNLPSQKTNVPGGGMTVSINASTSLVQAGLKAATYGIGHFSADKCPTSGTTFTGTTTGAYGCLKLANAGISTRTVAGQITGTIGYPTSANVTVGLYDYTSEEQMYVQGSPSPAETKFAQNLQTLASTFTNTAGFYNLTPLTTQPLTVPTNGTFYRVGEATTAGGAFAGGSNMCTGLVDTY